MSNEENKRKLLILFINLILLLSTLSELNGGVAQLVRAFGSYPKCRGFESPRRYQKGPVAQLVRAAVS